MSKIKVQGKSVIIELAVNIFREGKKYIAFCPALDLSTCGKSVSKAQDSFKEALELWFEVVLEKKNLKAALLELGWSFNKINGQVIPRPEDVNFNSVPIELLAQKYYPMNIPYSAIS